MISRYDWSIRQSIIPSGECVDGDAVELFAQIDETHADNAMIATAQAACEGCFQLKHCSDNRTEIGAILFKENGNLEAIIGKQAINNGDNESSSTIRERVLEPIITFDLRNLPQKPELALKVMRRAIRAKQLATGPNTPATIPVVANAARELIGERNQELLHYLQRPPHMSPKRASRGIERLVQNLFQQADYELYAVGKYSEKRYQAKPNDKQFWSETLPYWSRIIELFAADMLTLDQRRFSMPEKQALIFSPDEYARLLEAYGGEGGLTPGVLHHEISNWLYDPEQKLREIKARLHILREAYHGTDVPESVLVMRARNKLPADGSIPKLNAKKPPDHTSAIVIEAALAGELVAPEHRDLSRTVKAVASTFGDDPFFRIPSTLARYCHLPQEQALEQYQQVHARIQGLMTERHSDDPIPVTFIKDYALRHQKGCTYQDVVRNYAVTNATNRLKKRLKNAGNSVRDIEGWMVDRVYDLALDSDEFDKNVEGLYELQCRHRLLSIGLAEIRTLQDVNFNESVAAIVEPSTGRYLTFAPQLYDLSTSERLALASHFGVSRLLYGEAIDGDMLTAIIKTDDLAAYVEQIVLPKCRSIISVQSPSGQLPTSLRQLSEDIYWLRQAHDDDNQGAVAEPPAPNSDLVTVIGGAALHYGPNSIVLDIVMSDQLKSWLQHLILRRCYPIHDKVTSHIEQAIEENILVVSGDNANKFRIGFASYLLEAGDEQQLAALAHLHGIDHFMYGSELGDILRERLETSIEDAAAPLEELLHSQSKLRHPKEEEQWVDNELQRKVFRGRIVETKQAMAIICPELYNRTLRVVGSGSRRQLRFSDTTLTHSDPAALRAFVDSTSIQALLDTDSQEALRADSISTQKRRIAFEALQIRAQYTLNALTSSLLHRLPERQRPRVASEIASLALLKRRPNESPIPQQHLAYISQSKQSFALQWRTYTQVKKNAEPLGNAILGAFLQADADMSIATVIQSYLASQQPSRLLTSPLQYYQLYLEALVQFNSWLQIKTRKQ